MVGFAMRVTFSEHNLSIIGTFVEHNRKIYGAVQQIGTFFEHNRHCGNAHHPCILETVQMVGFRYEGHI